MQQLICSLRPAVPDGQEETTILARTLTERSAEILAYFDHPSFSNGPTEAVNGRLEHLRGIALGIRNLASLSPAASYTQYVSRTASLQKTAAQIAAIVAVILTPKWVLRPRRRSLCLRRRGSGRKTSQTSGHA